MDDEQTKARTDVIDAVKRMIEVAGPAPTMTLLDQLDIRIRLEYKPSPELIRKTAERIGRKAGFTLEEMVGPRRYRALAYARFEAWHISHRMHGNSLPKIGSVYNRDHTTILHGVLRWERDGLGRWPVPRPLAAA